MESYFSIVWFKLQRYFITLFLFASHPVVNFLPTNLHKRKFYNHSLRVWCTFHLNTTVLFVLGQKLFAGRFTAFVFLRRSLGNYVTIPHLRLSDSCRLVPALKIGYDRKFFFTNDWYLSHQSVNFVLYLFGLWDSLDLCLLATYNVYETDCLAELMLCSFCTGTYIWFCSSLSNRTKSIFE